MNRLGQDRARQLGRKIKASGPQGVVLTSAANGVVTVVTAGASTDGKAQVTVNVDGSATFAPYLDSYLTPTVGDIVRVQFTNGSPLILGRICGFPNF